MRRLAAVVTVIAMIILAPAVASALEFGVGSNTVPGGSASNYQYVCEACRDAVDHPADFMNWAYNNSLFGAEGGWMTIKMGHTFYLSNLLGDTVLMTVVPIMSRTLRIKMIFPNSDLEFKDYDTQEIGDKLLPVGRNSGQDLPPTTSGPASGGGGSGGGYSGGSSGGGYTGNAWYGSLEIMGGGAGSSNWTVEITDLD